METTADADQFRGWVREYCDLNKEITDAGKALNGLKKARQQLGESMMDWMELHGIGTVKAPGGTLQRQVTTRVGSISAPYVQERLAEYMEPDEATRITKSLWDNRVQTENRRLSLRKAAPNSSSSL